MTTLAQFLAAAREVPAAPLPPWKEDWKDRIARITAPGSVQEGDEETYWYFLEVLPPRYMGGGVFGFGEGADPVRLFWKTPPGRYFCRQLSDEETERFCTLAGIGRSSF